MTIFEILTLVSYLLGAVVAFIVKDKAGELTRQGILLNQTREEIAREYITKTEVRSDMEKIINRFDRLEAKLDRFIEGQK